MNINETAVLTLASAFVLIGVSATYPDTNLTEFFHTRIVTVRKVDLGITVLLN